MEGTFMEITESSHRTAHTGQMGCEGKYDDLMVERPEPVTDNQTNCMRTEQDADLSHDLSGREANWFLDVLEVYHQKGLTMEELETLEQTKLRKRTKHRASILFSEDVNFIIRGEHKFQLNWNDPNCRKCPKTWIVHRLCKVLIAKYQNSLRNKSSRSCIWSALMERGLWHLKASGFEDATIQPNDGCNKEATLFVGKYHVSRSNFTKVLKRYIGE
mmetsp:Transcript_40680/g.65325  ORF Transcript_40680/g.65325 Transcript_40680/m.65325 type:complete len:216 (+) Transcript_40680:1-648(+)